MTKIEQSRLLKELALTPMGQALKSYLEDKIKELGDVRKLPTGDFEIQGKANIMAITKLEQVLHTLRLLGQEKSRKQKNPYE